MMALRSSGIVDGEGSWWRNAHAKGGVGGCGVGGSWNKGPTEVMVKC